MKDFQSMLNYSQCLEIIEHRIATIPGIKEPVELYDPIRYILEMGGKRIRPCLSLLSHQLFSGDLSTVIDPAIGLEIFHNFTLLHDDIMDNSPLRRNIPTVHIKWNTNVAILSGDAMMILAYHLISSSNDIRIMKIFNQTALEVCEGQQMDMNFESRQDVEEKEYLEMIRLKTAVLLAASLAIGGITGHASEEDIKRLFQLGIHIGIAFQLQDDLLDVFADSEKFGKQIGNDIVSNKKTFLLIKALNSGNREAAAELKKWISMKEFVPQEKITAVKELYRNLEIDVHTRKIADSYFVEGLKSLENINAPVENKEELKKLIFYIMQRER